MVIRAHRLRENVLYTCGLEDSADAATCNQTGTGTSGAEKNFTTVVLTKDVMRNGVSLEFDVHEVLASVFRALSDSIGDFVRFSVTDADVTLAIANDGKG